MAARHTFTAITPAILKQLAERRRGGIKIVFNEDRRTGRASGTLPVGWVEVGFSYAHDRNELTLTVLKKPMLVPAPLLWAEFSFALREAAAVADPDAAVPEKAAPAPEMSPSRVGDGAV